MRSITHTLRNASLIAMLAAVPSFAQTVTQSGGNVTKDSSAAKAENPQSSLLVPAIYIQRLRPNDQRGVNEFESAKETSIPFAGFQLNFGAAFTQQYQALQHSNTAAPKVVSGVDQNLLVPIGNGFNNAVANLYLNAQLADGIRVAMTTYLSARHHQDTWVKDGYFLIDKAPFKFAPTDLLMKYTTLRVGHFEIDYGDQHYRRTDNGQSLYNPFVGNLLMDAFTTEIGAEAYFRSQGIIAMGGVTGGLIHGQIQSPGKRAPTYIGKLGFDKQLTTDLRARLTGSAYVNWNSASNTLYTGDRAGSRYYDVMEYSSDETANAWSGNVRPGFSNVVHSYVLNPFVKYDGLEYFGNFETSTGKATAEVHKRTVRQMSNELVYRFLKDQLYVAGRYNTVNGEVASTFGGDQTVTRSAVSGGWYVTPLVLAKIEYVNQTYDNFPTSDIRNGGKFKGFMIEGAVAF